MRLKKKGFPPEATSSCPGKVTARLPERSSVLMVPSVLVEQRRASADRRAGAGRSRRVARRPWGRFWAAMSCVAVGLIAIAPRDVSAGWLNPLSFGSQGTLSLTSGTYTINTSGAAPVLENSSGTVLYMGTTFNQGGSFDPTVAVGGHDQRHRFRPARTFIADQYRDSRHDRRQWERWSKYGHRGRRGRSRGWGWGRWGRARRRRGLRSRGWSSDRILWLVDRVGWSWWWIWGPRRVACQ
jgi:hypothetical protein